MQEATCAKGEIIDNTYDEGKITDDALAKGDITDVEIDERDCTFESKVRKCEKCGSDECSESLCQRCLDKVLGG